MPTTDSTTDPTDHHDLDTVDVEYPSPAAASDDGIATVEILSWSAMMVVAIVAISAVLQVLGVDVINYVRDQIGI